MATSPPESDGATRVAYILGVPLAEDGRLYRNVSIGELKDGKAVKVADYWGEPTDTPEWRRDLTARLEMPGDGIWPDDGHLSHY